MAADFLLVTLKDHDFLLRVDEARSFEETARAGVCGCHDSQHLRRG
jgi:hypothetical protein